MTAVHWLMSVGPAPAWLSEVIAYATIGVFIAGHVYLVIKYWHKK